MPAASCRFRTEGGVLKAWLAFWDRAPARATNTRLSGRDLNGDIILYTVFTANFVGILCSRTLHYQFYCW